MASIDILTNWRDVMCDAVRADGGVRLVMKDGRLVNVDPGEGMTGYSDLYF